MLTRLEELRDPAVRIRLGAAAFAQWASRFRGCPSNPASLVYDADQAEDHLGTLTTTWEGRRVEWKSIPGSARTRPEQPPLIAPGMIDPWLADERDLRARSDHIAVCDGCGGEGKGACGVCRGTGSLLCTACNGQRKQYGYAANGSYRLLNCAACRGKGEVNCVECRRGIAVCAVCGGEKRVQRWLTIERWQRDTTARYPSWLAAEHGQVVATVEVPRQLLPADLGGIAAEWLDRLATDRPQPGERVVRQQLRIVRVPRLVVHYRIAGEDETVQFGGLPLLPLQTTAPPSFTFRSKVMRVLAAVLVVVGLVVTVLYLGRGLFYWSGPSFAAIASLAVMLALLYGAAADHTGPRRHTRRWLSGAFAAMLLVLLFVLLARPRESHARALIAAGDFDVAELELELLGADASLLADLRLARIRRTAQLSLLRAELAAIPRGLPQFSAAAAIVDAEVLKLARARLDAGQFAEAVELVSTLSSPAAGEPILRAIRAEAERNAAEALAARDAAARLRLRLVAEKAWSALQRVGEADEELVATRSAMARDVAALEARRRN